MQTSPPSRCNNFGFIRFVLATSVLWAHCYPLTGGPTSFDPIARLSRYQETAGSMAVSLFFVLSGFLITKSWVESSSANQFLKKRILRIYPGYIVAVLVTLLLTAACTSTRTYLKQVFGGGDNVLRNLVFLNYGASENGLAFPHNPYPCSANGSLWTIQPEFFCYLLVMALGVFDGLRSRKLVLALFVMAYAGHVVYAQYVHVADTGYYRFLVFFLSGMTAYSFPAIFVRTGILSRIAMLAALVIAFRIPPGLSLVLPLIGPALLLGFAFDRRVPLARVPAGNNDLSYGIYLYAFPIQQALVHWFKISHPWALFAAAAPVCVVVAYVSWKLIEQPSLALTKSAVLSTASPRPVPPTEKLARRDAPHAISPAVVAN